MRHWPVHLTQRQWGVCLTAAAVILAAAFLRYLLIPSGRECSALRAQLQTKNIEYTRLARNVEMKQPVDAAFGRLGPQANQNESDPLTLAAWLRELEMLARLPGMTLNNMKALPVRQERAYKVYRVRLSVSGKLPEVLRFVSASTHGDSIAGLESFSLRGIQGMNMVECGLSLRLIRLLPEAKKEGGDGR